MARIVDVTALIDGSRIGRCQATVFAICGALAMFDGYDLQSISYAAPAIARAWGLPVASFGPIFGAGIAGLLVGTIALAYVADWRGRKLCMLGSLTIIGLAILTTAWTTSLTALLVLRFVTGLGIGSLVPNIMTTSSEFSPKRGRARSVTMMTASVATGSVLGGSLAAWAIPHFGWQAVFYVGALLPLATIPVVATLMPESIRFLVAKRNDDRPRIAAVLARIVPGQRFYRDDSYVLREETAPGLAFVELFAHGRAVKTGILWLAFFFAQMTVFFAGSWMPSILTEEGLPLSQAITAASMFQGGGIIGPIAMGWLADHFRGHRVVSSFALAGALLMCTIGLAGATLGAAMTACLVTGFFIFGTLGGIIALAASVYPTAMRSTGLGWLSGVGRIGSLIGAVVGGLLLATGMPKEQLFYVAALAPLIAASAAFAFGRITTRASAPPRDLPTGSTLPT